MTSKFLSGPKFTLWHKSVAVIRNRRHGSILPLFGHMLTALCADTPDSIPVPYRLHHKAA